MTTTAKATAANEAATIVRAAGAVLDAARAAVDAFGPAPLLGTDSEWGEYEAATADARAVVDAAEVAWSTASAKWQAARDAALDEDYGYMAPVAE